VRFYAGKKLRLETTLCWSCSNFFVTEPFEGLWGFDVGAKEADEFLADLRQLLPDSIP
jgi:hypothetical protein